MWVYWVLFWWPALAAIGFFQTQSTDSVLKISMWVFAFVVFLAIGLRFEVGVDWINYLNHLYESETLSLAEVLAGSDPAYGLLGWISARSGIGVWLSNVAAAAMFVSGLFLFCRKLPNPWLALTSAIPYMAIVMAMNYTRQGAAFGLVLWALVALREGRVKRFIAFVVVATLFHKTAALLIPIALLGIDASRLKNMLWVAVSAIIGYGLFIAEHQIGFYENYILEQYASDGAAVRVAMNSVAAICFLLVRSLTDMNPLDKALWTRFSMVTLCFIPLLILSPSSTAVDRMALYFMPIQLVASSYLPNIVARWGLKNIVIILLIAAYWLVMFVWFNYGVFSNAWLPYKFYPLEAT